jgi:hypothetical protein
VFAQPDELAAYLQTEFSAQQDLTAELLLENATGRIRGWTGQTIAPTTTAIRRWRQAGYGRLFLPHPPAIPVTVTAVEVDGVAVDVWDIDELHSMPGWWGDVTVTYTHGFPEPPADVRDVCLKLAVRAMSNPTFTQSVKLEGFSETFQTSTELSEDRMLSALAHYRTAGIR